MDVAVIEFSSEVSNNLVLWFVQKQSTKTVMERLQSMVHQEKGGHQVSMWEVITTMAATTIGTYLGTN